MNVDWNLAIILIGDKCNDFVIPVVLFINIPFDSQHIIVVNCLQATVTLGAMVIGEIDPFSISWGKLVHNKDSSKNSKVSLRLIVQKKAI